jgi:hypothetical protein
MSLEAVSKNVLATEIHGTTQKFLNDYGDSKRSGVIVRVIPCDSVAILETGSKEIRVPAVADIPAMAEVFPVSFRVAPREAAAEFRPGFPVPALGAAGGSPARGAERQCRVLQPPTTRAARFSP